MFYIRNVIMAYYKMKKIQELIEQANQEIELLKIQAPNNLLKKSRQIKNNLLKNFKESNQRIDLNEFITLEHYLESQKKPKDKSETIQLKLINSQSNNG